MEVKDVLDFIIIYAIPLVAFTISIASFQESRKVTKVQLKLNEMEEKLKKYELEELEKARTIANIPKVDARIYSISKQNHRLKIWNSGQVEAYEVDFQVPEALEVYRDKVPFEVLDPGNSFEEIVIVFFETPRKSTIKLTWKDNTGKEYVKEQIITI